MSLYPSAAWQPIRDTGTRAVTKDILCLHTMVGGMRGTWSYFDRLDVGVYSHFLVGGIWGSDAGQGLDGVAWQIADTDYRAAANLDGNWHVISVETADNAERPIAPWTPRQCDALVRIMIDANRLDGIPLELIPDSTIGQRGIAYHRLGCDPYRVDGGELWSSAYGKDCPTQARIDQIPGLIDRARAVVAGGEETDDMTPEECEAAIRRVFRLPSTGLAVPYGQPHNGNMYVKLLDTIRGNTNALSAVRAAVDAVRADQSVSGEREEKALTMLAEIEADLPAPTPEPTPEPTA